MAIGGRPEDGGGHDDGAADREVHHPAFSLCERVLVVAVEAGEEMILLKYIVEHVRPIGRFVVGRNVHDHLVVEVEFELLAAEFLHTTLTEDLVASFPGAADRDPAGAEPVKIVIEDKLLASGSTTIGGLNGSTAASGSGSIVSALFPKRGVRNAVLDRAKDTTYDVESSP
jgi:hypothetical protein